MCPKENKTMKCLQPPSWVRPRGYSNGVVATGPTVFVSGMIGLDANSKFVSHDLVGQARQALKNVVEVLSQAGAKPEHIVRMNWYVVDKNEYVSARKELGVIYQEIMGRHYPAMTAIQVTSLIEDSARVEIEVTAVIPA
jgi:enamine deaminase RidA (YjgF/YER057c/UK114 family)